MITRTKLEARVARRQNLMMMYHEILKQLQLEQEADHAALTCLTKEYESKRTVSAMFARARVRSLKAFVELHGYTLSLPTCYYDLSPQAQQCFNRDVRDTVKELENHG